MRYQIARRATLVNSSLNLFLALLKIILGFLGHSHALLADGIHSFADLLTDGLILFAARMGTQKPDKEHPYGHRRVETIATIILSFVLLGVALSIAYDTLHHVVSNLKTSKPDFFVIIAAVLSIISNECLYHYTLFSSKKINSELLRNYAYHNRSDALVSLVVLMSVIGALLGIPKLDSIGALIIALLILKMAIQMIWKSVKELIDTAVDEKLIQDISHYILKVSGVNAIHQLRSRSHGENIFLDLHIEVDPSISVSEAHYISEKVNIDLCRHFKNITDVTVHIDPENDENFMISKDLPDRHTLLLLLQDRWVDLKAYREVKKTILHYLQGKLHIELYLPLAFLEINKLTPEQVLQNFKNKIADLSIIHSLKIYYE